MRAVVELFQHLGPILITPKLLLKILNVSFIEKIDIGAFTQQKAVVYFNQEFLTSEHSI